MLATQEAALGFDFGSHATTFGGTPLATAAALEVLNIIGNDSFLSEVRQKGEYFKDQLLKLKEKHSRVVAVRGEGLLIGLEIDQDAAFFVRELMEKGFIINGIQDKVLRFAPPLIIEKTDIDKLVTALGNLF